MKPATVLWTEQERTTLREMWPTAQSAAQIADVLDGRSKNAVIGEAHRLKLPRKRTGPPRTPRPPKPPKQAGNPACAAAATQAIPVQQAPAAETGSAEQRQQGGTEGSVALRPPRLRHRSGRKTPPKTAVELAS